MKVIIVSLVCLVSLFGQGGYTVYQKLVTDASVNNAVFGPVNNIGQSTHQFTLVFKDAPGQTCDQPRNNLNFANDFEFEVINTNAPADLNTQSRMTLFVTSSYVGANVAAQRFSKTYVGTGVNPFTYVRFQNFNFTKCRVDVYYSGSLNTSFNDPIISKFNLGQLDSILNYSVSTATGASTDVIPVNTYPFQGPEIYSLVMTNLGAASAGDYTINLVAPSGGVTTIATYRFGANATIVLPINNLPYFKFENGSGLRVTNNTGQTIRTNCLIRLE